MKVTCVDRKFYPKSCVPQSQPRQIILIRKILFLILIYLNIIFSMLDSMWQDEEIKILFQNSYFRKYFGLNVILFSIFFFSSFCMNIFSAIHDGRNKHLPNRNNTRWKPIKWPLRYNSATSFCLHILWTVKELFVFSFS